ncbi:MAG TPA: PIN domain-containing protein [Solirubrobacteraceae bacterium]
MSDATRPPRAVLDTDVIYSRVLHELIGRLAYQERLLTLIWSDELLSEARRTLITGKPVSQQVAERWVNYMRQAFPDQRIRIDQLPADVDLATLTADPGDHHVCALAIAGHADLLLTFDQGYISESLAERGIRVLTPDAFLDTTLQDNPDAIIGAIQAQAEAWGGGRSIDELLDAIQRAGAAVFASNARRLINM